MGWYRKFRDNAKGPQGHKRIKVFAAWHGEFGNPLFTDEALPQSFPGTCFFNQDGEFHFVSDTVDPPPRRNASRRTPLHGILGIICGLYAFIWGWMNAEQQGLKKVMIIWTVLIIVSIALNGMTAMTLQSVE